MTDEVCQHEFVLMPIGSDGQLLTSVGNSPSYPAGMFCRWCHAPAEVNPTPPHVDTVQGKGEAVAVHVEYTRKCPPGCISGGGGESMFWGSTLNDAAAFADGLRARSDVESVTVTPLYAAPSFGEVKIKGLDREAHPGDHINLLKAVVAFCDTDLIQKITTFVVEQRGSAIGTGGSQNSDGATFQDRVQPWMMACFGPEISADRLERNHRFLEEALELVQSTGCTQSEAHQLVDYVFGRPVGETHQEIGGVMVTLAALCLALGDDMHKAGETELARIWTKVEKIRAKQAAKPKHSPLPGPSEATADAARMREALESMPATVDRRPLYDDRPDLYLESDKDWARNNSDAVRWLADNHEAIRLALATSDEPMQARTSVTDMKGGVK